MGWYHILFGVILPYAALMAFVVGAVYRVVQLASGPQVLKWTLFPLRPSGERFRLSLYQLFGLRSLFRHNRGLWLGAWLFHLSLWAVLLWHVIRFAGFEATFWLTADEWIDAVGKWILLASLLYLAVFRLTVGPMRNISGAPEFFNLALMLALVISGIYLKGNVDPYETGLYLVSLVSFSPELLPEGGPWFLMHWLLFLLLLVLLPHGKMSHFITQFFLKYRIDWVDWKKKPYLKAR